MLDSGHSLFYLSLIQIHFIARNAKLSHRGSGMANASQVSISEPFVPKEWAVYTLEHHENQVIKLQDCKHTLSQAQIC